MSALWDAWEADQTATTFKALFPEFRNASDAIVEARIAMASQRVPEDVWGDHRYQGIAQLTAHLLCLLPEAKDMRKGLEPGETPYSPEWRTLCRIVSGGFRVAGLPETD